MAGILPMKRFRCTVAYVGAAYNGWQSQANGNGVQDIIEEAIFRVAKERISVKASGRTDAGVSARGQVFHFDTEKELTARKWMGAINCFLPKDIRIMSVEETDRLFHARYCVKMKQYDYCINIGPYDVFTRDTAYQCPVQLDIGKMEEASRYLIGTHDFTSLNSSPLSEYPDQVRTVKDIVFHREGNILRISYYGKGFLRYMVRMMIAQLIEAGKGRIQPSDIPEILEQKSRTSFRKNAPANGLTLVKVDYFEVLALSKEFMVREILDGDDLSAYPENITHVFTERHSQTVYGYFVPEEARLYVGGDHREDAEELSDQLDEWMTKHHPEITKDIEIV